jgi:4-amino-4-deoxy-L-arabinose transferase-like glycosyltransferase
MLKKAEKRITSNKWLAVILGLTLLMRLPSLFEPYWYGDEAIYLTIGQALRKGVQLYSQIHDNKPPFLYLIAALVNGNEFWFKFTATIWMMVTIYVFYRLARKLFNKRVWVLTATALFAFLTSWTKLEGNIANAELFFLLPTITTVLILWDKTISLKRVAFAGFILGLGVLFKMPPILEAGIWPLLWLVSGNKDWWKKTIALGMGILIPLGISILYFWTQNSLAEYLKAAWLQNLPYLTSWSTTTNASGIYSIKDRAVLACLILVPILGFAKSIGRRGVLIGLWGTLTLFATLLSGRPYPHYLLQAAAVMAITPVLIFSGKTAEKIIGGVVVLMIAGAVIGFNFYNYPAIGYYSNFIKWAAKKESRQEYFTWFDSNINNNYKAAEIIKSGTNPKDKIFVWGDMPMLYALSDRSPTGKYTVKYHIKELHAENETMELLINEPPKYIISYGHEDELPGLQGWLEDSYMLQKNIGQIKIFRLSILSQTPN